MELRLPFQPAELHVVLSDHARVRGRSLAAINPAIWSDHRTIRVMIANVRKSADQCRPSAVRRHAQDAAALQFTPFGDTESAVRKGDASPGPFRPPVITVSLLPFAFTRPQPWHGEIFSVRITRLRHMRAPIAIKRDARRISESARHRLGRDSRSARQCPRDYRRRSAEGRLPATGRRPDVIATGGRCRRGEHECDESSPVQNHSMD